MGFKEGKFCKNKACKDSNCKDFLCGVELEYPVFVQCIAPRGGLDRTMESHALFYYYLLAQKAIEIQASEIVYEGDVDPVYKHLELLKSVAIFYQVDVHNMTNAWKAVDLTCLMQGLPKLPNKYRYTSKIVLH